jgi:hypothetical protein
MYWTMMGSSKGERGIVRCEVYQDRYGERVAQPGANSP